MPFTPGRPLSEAKAELFKALAHPGRVRVLELLVEGERTMGDLAAGTGMELSHLSQQVRVLRRAGVVDGRRVKNTVVCSLRDPQTADLLEVARRMLHRTLRDDQALLAALDGAFDGAEGRRTVAEHVVDHDVERDTPTVPRPAQWASTTHPSRNGT